MNENWGQVTVTVKLMVLADVVMRDQQETAGAASWIVDGLPWRPQSA